MDYPPLDGLVLEVELFLLPLELLFSIDLGFLQFFLIVDGIQEIRHICVFSVHLVFLSSSMSHDVFDFTLGEELLDLVEIEFLEHVLHYVVYAVRH
jgi:hypothetical protein